MGCRVASLSTECSVCSITRATEPERKGYKAAEDNERGAETRNQDVEVRAPALHCEISLYRGEDERGLDCGDDRCVGASSRRIEVV